MKLTKCPICGDELSVTQLSCKPCKIEINGDFETCEFCNITGESLNFLRSFVRCRGIIKDIEKELGISYPTVRNRLDKLISELGYGETQVKTKDEQRYEVLQGVKDGKILPKTAIEALKNIS